MLDDDGFDATDAGIMFALYGYQQDRQTDAITAAIDRAGRRAEEDRLITEHDPTDVHVHVHLDDEDKTIQPVNALDYTTGPPASWDSYVGQAPLKRKIATHIRSAQMRGERLPHILLASGYPGVGKTTMARLIAQTMQVKIIELVPPFNIYTLVEAAKQLDDHDILFIDEIHKLADTGKRGAEILLKVLEDGVAFLPDGTTVEFADITVIGATTDRDKLPEPVIDRFKIQPYFQAYSDEELFKITLMFAFRMRCEDLVDDEPAAAIALACRGTPRICEEMVIAARDLHYSLNRNCTGDELLEFLEVEHDGLTRTHIHYLTALYQYYGRETKDGGWEYIVGEAAMQQILRETKPGIGRIERFLVEQGLIDRTPRGRRLTARGIQRAREFIADGKGVRDVA